MIEKTSFVKTKPVLHDIKREDHNIFKGKEQADARRNVYKYGTPKDLKEHVSKVGVTHKVNMKPHCVSANNSTWRHGYTRRSEIK